MKKLILTLALILALNSAAFIETDFPFDVKISGKGTKSIIFIPGFSCSGEVWNETLKMFEADFKCYVLTMPGFAGVKPETNPDLNGWVKSVANYIAEKNIEKPVIVGHSLGGLMALWIAADYPELVSKIVVIDALPSLNALFDTTFKASENPVCTEFDDNYKNMNDEQLYQNQKMTIQQLLGDTSKTETIIRWTLTSDRNTLGSIICQLLNTDLREKLGNIKCPSLILLEPNFKMMSTAIEKQYSKLQVADIKYATKGLHFVMFDDKEWCIGQLKNFIQ